MKQTFQEWIKLHESSFIRPEDMVRQYIDTDDESNIVDLTNTMMVVDKIIENPRRMIRLTVPEKRIFLRSVLSNIIIHFGMESDSYKKREWSLIHDWSIFNNYINNGDYNSFLSNLESVIAGIPSGFEERKEVLQQAYDLLAGPWKIAMEKLGQIMIKNEGLDEKEEKFTTSANRIGSITRELYQLIPRAIDLTGEHLSRAIRNEIATLLFNLLRMNHSWTNPIEPSEDIYNAKKGSVDQFSKTISNIEALLSNARNALQNLNISALSGLNSSINMITAIINEISNVRGIMFKYIQNGQEFYHELNHLLELLRRSVNQINILGDI